MSLMMQPMQAEGGYNMLTGQGTRERSSFSNHFEQKLEAIASRNSDKLGVDGQTQSLSDNREERLSSLLQKEKEGRAENERAAAILSIFLQDLQEVAKQKDLGPGEWEVAITDREALKDLALDAGMSEGQLGALMDKLGGEDNKLDVTAIMESLDRQLRDVEEGKVTVPETRLPFLESLLTKMGMDSSQIRKLAADAVTGDNRLDLGKHRKASFQRTGTTGCGNYRHPSAPSPTAQTGFPPRATPGTRWSGSWSVPRVPSQCSWSVPNTSGGPDHGLSRSASRA